MSFSATGYGEATSASGYGGYSRYVDCNSALALLGFVLFVDILRDIVEYVTTSGRRKKRWIIQDNGLWAGGNRDPTENGMWEPTVKENGMRELTENGLRATENGSWSMREEIGGNEEKDRKSWREPDILTFITEGGAEHLYDTLPSILLPLLEGWWELSGGEQHPEAAHCLQQGVCQANWVLASHYGVTGRVLATLLSNVGSGAFPGREGELVQATLRAAREGRRLIRPCEHAFPACPYLHQRHRQPFYNSTVAAPSVVP